MHNEGRPQKVILFGSDQDSGSESIHSHTHWHSSVEGQQRKVPTLERQKVGFKDSKIQQSHLDSEARTQAQDQVGKNNESIIQ